MPVQRIDFSYTFLWSIPDFFERPAHLYEKLQPKDFSPGDRPFIKSCMLGLTREPADSPLASISVDLEYERPTPLLAESCRLTFVIMDNTGEFHRRKELRTATVGESGRYYYDVKNFLHENDLRDRAQKLLQQPSNTLRLLFRMRYVSEPMGIGSEASVVLYEEMKVEVSPVNRFRKLLEDQRFWDAIIVESDNEDVRKAILGVDVDDNPLTDRSKNQDAVEVDDKDYEVLKTVLEFLYMEKFVELKEPKDDICMVGKKYYLDALREDCERDVVGNLTVDNALRVLILVDVCGSCELKRIITDFIGKYGPSVTRTEIFKELKNWHPQLLEDILCKVLESM